ncbi:MAG TPA: hypothetical protein DDW76_11280 [Cyanobacteria bacterium UBA11369]|nr:hypothetical protein [Cyanobacteria bacterium UBA11368]HBE49352.1 hypothetical protein [Cyanobacteria bacterium UBA11369]
MDSRGTQGDGDRKDMSQRNQPNSSPLTEIVEATGWYTHDKGKVVLTASAPTRYRLWQNPRLCK